MTNFSFKKIRWRILLCICLAFWCLTGCGKQEEESGITIAVSVIGETHKWPVGVRYYAEKAVKKIAEENDWDYVFCVGDDANEQSDQVVQLVNDEVDCIIMLPMDGASLKTAAMTVKRADIPLVIIDREIPDFAPTATVKGDNTAIGSVTADIFNGMFPDGTYVLEIMGDTSTVPQQRTDGFDEAIHDNFQKEQVGYTGWNQKDSSELFQQWILENEEGTLEKVGAIFTHDDEIALGVLEVLDSYKAENIKILPNLKVIAGSAGAKEMYLRMMKEEDYSLFSLTYTPRMVETAIEIGEKIIKGEDYEEMTIIQTKEVNKRNVTEFYNPNAPY